MPLIDDAMIYISLIASIAQLRRVQNPTLFVDDQRRLCKLVDVLDNGFRESSSELQCYSLR